jgi:quinolinate synthase
MSSQTINLAQSIPIELANSINNLASSVVLPAYLTEREKALLVKKIKKLLKEKKAQIVAHYYVDHDLQALAEETGGKVADSLEMANFGAQSSASTLVVCGVKFMGETSKMISPEKTILMPDIEATCSLDKGCPADEFRSFCNQYPEHTVVVYANTSVEVKAIADWVVTSGNALEIVNHLKKQGKKIIWGPDRHLGSWIQSETGIEMILWQGQCIVHDEFQVFELQELKKLNPRAKVLVHPESPAEVVELADVVGSTRVMIEAVQTMPDQKFIVATDNGIFWKMKQLAPHKKLIVAPTGGKDGHCISCAHCPWMAINGLQNLHDCLLSGTGEIFLEETIRLRALRSINKMLDFSRKKGLIAKKEVKKA